MVDQNILRLYEEHQGLTNKKIEFEAAVDLNKCLKKIEIPNAIHRCATYSELPSHINTM